MSKLERVLIAAVVLLTGSTVLLQWAPVAHSQATLSPELIRKLDTLAKPYAGEQVAEFTRKYYTSLVAKGFSEEQAMQIVVSMGAPNIGGQ
jgi:hypothetical protein